jgi:glycosyltransferase EpsE
MPKVSILMGIYNGERVLEKAIDSLRTQTYRDWECIVCDDGSTDGTWSVLETLVQGDGRFILLRNERNRGLASTLNRCIEIASGEYLARQDADDVSAPTRLEVQVNFLDEHPSVTVAGTYAALVDRKGAWWGDIRHPLAPTPWDWVRGAKVVHASVLMRAQDIRAVRGYDTGAVRVEDYDLWFRLLANGATIVTIPQVLYFISWEFSDYGRRRFVDRITEVAVRRKGIRALRVHPISLLYVIKPILVGMIPQKLLYLYHLRKLRNMAAPSA